MPLDDIRAQVEKLTPQPGDLITVILSRRLSHDELDTVRDMLFRILPVGCKVAILPPDVTLIVSPAEAAPHA